MEEDLTVEVPGGPDLEARLGVAASARGGLVICHPHPLYGGDMDNPVVVRAVEVASESGLSTLRFNFRGVGRSSGQHAHGQGEAEDLKAALEALRSRVPERCPLGAAGYSFGAWVAARVAGSGTPLAALCLIAPPTSLLDFGPLGSADADVLLVSGTSDPYCPHDALVALAARFRAARVDTIEGADHFFFGKLFPLGETIRDWARGWAAR
jgi:alpha/beta superfamily hydrolase